MSASTLSTFIGELSHAMAAKTLIELSDRELVEQFLAAQSEAVFVALVRRHGPMVYRVCRRVLQQEQDAEDAFQATFLVLAQKLPSVRKLASLASWLHGVAHRLALKAKAQAALRRRHEQQASTAKIEPLDAPTWKEICSVLDAELVALPEKWRMPLVLCYLEGRTQDEAAGQLGWSKNTLRRRLEEARAILGQRLRRRGIAMPAALSALLLSDSLVSAALPSAVVISTAADATRIASGAAVASVVSGKVAALLNGVGTITARIQLGMLLLVGLLGTAVALSAQSMTLPESPTVPDKGLTTSATGRPQDRKPDQKAMALGGRWQMTLPAGFKREVTIRPLGANRFSLENAVRFSGVYELRQSRLVLSKPATPNEKEWTWELRGGGEWVLVAQPPPEKTGQNYLGATLKRVASADRQTEKTPTRRLTPANVKDQPLSFAIKVKRFQDKNKGEYLYFAVTVKAKDIPFRLSPRRSAELKVVQGEKVLASSTVQAVERGGEVQYSFQLAAKDADKSRFHFDEMLGHLDAAHGSHSYWFDVKDFVEPK